MAYTVTKLITNAYYLSGIVSREFQTVSGSQFSDGLDILNDILMDKSVDTGMIPYRSRSYETTVNGQEEYFIPGLVLVDTVTFDVDTVRYHLERQDVRNYQGSARANNITTLPYKYHFERELNGGRIFLYFIPDGAYPLTIWGMSALTQVVQGQDLELILDRFYIAYLKYALAERICIEFNYDIPSGIEKRLKAYENQIDNNSAPRDMTLQKRSTLNGDTDGPIWSIVNFGGWMP